MQVGCSKIIQLLISSKSIHQELRIGVHCMKWNVLLVALHQKTNTTHINTQSPLLLKNPSSPSNTSTFQSTVFHGYPYHSLSSCLIPTPTSVNNVEVSSPINLPAPHQKPKEGCENQIITASKKREVYLKPPSKMLTFRIHWISSVISDPLMTAGRINILGR